MTCFSSVWGPNNCRGPMSCDFFPRHFTDDAGLLHFSAFFTLQMTWEFAFFLGGGCPTTPMSSAGSIAKMRARTKARWTTTKTHKNNDSDNNGNNNSNNSNNNNSNNDSQGQNINNKQQTTHLIRNIIANYWCGVHRSCTNNPIKLTGSL